MRTLQRYTSCPHMWVFDARARVHLDLTQAQFPGGRRGVVAFRTDVGATTLARIARGVVGGSMRPG
jgi:hypothetical protein